MIHAKAGVTVMKAMTPDVSLSSDGVPLSGLPPAGTTSYRRSTIGPGSMYRPAPSIQVPSTSVT